MKAQSYCPKNQKVLLIIIYEEKQRDTLSNPTFYHSFFFKRLLAVQILYQSKLHTLKNPMMYTFPRLSQKKLQEARLNTYQTCTDGHAGIEREAMEKEGCVTVTSLNIYVWHY